MAAATACGDSSPAAPDTTVTRITLSAEGPTTLALNEVVKLTATAYTAGNTVVTPPNLQFSSDNFRVATVDAQGYVIPQGDPGTAHVVALVGTVRSAPVTVTVPVGVPDHFTVLRTLPPHIPVGTGDTVKLRLNDAAGTALPNVAISIDVYSGGSYTPLTRTTDANGVIAFPWTIGTSTDYAYQVYAHAGKAELHLTTVGDAGPAATIDVGQGQKYLDLPVGQQRAFPLTIRDAYNNAIPWSGTTITTRNRAIATIDPVNGTVTGVAPGQTVVVATTPGGLTDSLAVIVVPQGGVFVATNLSQFDVARGSDVATQVVVHYDPVTYPGSTPTRIGSATIVVTWDPALLTYRGSDSWWGDLVINDTEAATGRLTFSFVSPDGLPGTVGLINLAFTASSTAGRSGTLRTAVTELWTARTFNDLLPTTLGVSQLLRIQ